ncbi:MAG: SdrD B-like domain-containing protein [Acidobacteriota bacterium]
MNVRKLIGAILVLGLCWVLSWPAGGTYVSQARAAQISDLPKNATIVVADRPLTGSFSLPQQRGNRMFLPAIIVARALGDSVRVDAVARNLEVHRQTGIVASFDARLNQVRENGSIVLVVSDTADIVFPPNPDELMLPIEILAPLLDVSIILDKTSGTVSIRRGVATAEAVRAGAQHAPWELYQVDYSSNLNMYSSAFNHNFMVHSSGRIKDGRFDLLSNFDGGTAQGPLIFRRSTFTFERENGQRLVGGDFGTGTDLEFLSSAVRGVSIQQPFNNVRVTMFGGRAISDVYSNIVRVDPLTELPIETPQHTKARYDTNVFGAFATFGPSVKKPTDPRFLIFSSGLMYFSGPMTRGELATGSVKFNSHRNQFQGDVGLGNFSGITPNKREVHGFAPLIDLSESFSVSDGFTLRARYTHIGSNFLSPQSGGLFTPMNLVSGGFNWRLAQWLSTSLTGTSRTLLDAFSRTIPVSNQAGQPGQVDRSITTTVSVNPRGIWPTFTFTHTQANNSLTGANAYTLLNATKEFRSWRLFGNFTRILNGQFLNLETASTPDMTPPSSNVTVGAMMKINDSNTLQVSQSFGSGGSLGGEVDWMASSFLSKRVTFGAGLGYAMTGSQLALVERALATVQLPFQQTLQVSYINTPSGPQIMVQLRGALLRTRRAEAAQYGALAEIRSFGALSGKVYQDINLNGQFDPGVDRPQEGVQVRVDGSYYEVSDRNGDFRVENVKAGEHQIYMDLLSVRADLTLLTSAQHTVALKPGRDMIVDFRLVRTGRIKGVVWMDLNGNGKIDEGEQPLADVRVVTGSGRDTLTDAQGEFVLGDLPPGEHIVLVDEKTLPENTRSAAGSLQVIVKAGSETGNTNFPVASKPVEVKVKSFASTAQKP